MHTPAVSKCGRSECGSASGEKLHGNHTGRIDIQQYSPNELEITYGSICEITPYVWVHPDEERRGASLRGPRSGLCGSRRRAFETMPRRFDLGVGGPVASRPYLCGGCRIFGYVEPNNGTGCAANEPGMLTGFGL
jgi:hypothetical protein